MARIVLGIATSHTPMLNTPAKDWPSFIDRDGVREFLDKEGDPATYELLGRGQTVGVFQFESTGMQDYLRKLQWDGQEDPTGKKIDKDHP